MDIEKLSPQEHRIFLMKALVWVIGLGWVGFVMALGGFFHGWIAALYIVCCGVILGPKFAKKQIVRSVSKEYWIVVACITAFVVFLSFFTQPSIFSGRDQGALSEAAIRLAQNHQLHFSTPASETFFAIYGPGKALNFPGFYYTATGELTTQFPLGYISYLAIFYAWFGTAGLLIANAFLAFFFLLAFYVLLREFVSRKFAALGLAFAMTSFPIIWFFKFTLTETMALALLWTGIFLLIQTLKKPALFSYGALVATFILLAFTRIEGFAFLALVILILGLQPETRAFLKKHPGQTILLPLTVFVFFALFNGIVDLPFYKEIAKAVLKPLLNHAAATSGALGTLSLLKILTIFGMLSFFLVGLMGISVALQKRNLLVLITGFVISPTIVYFINANISQDFPWMLRRFTFALFPAAVFYATYFLFEKSNASRNRNSRVLISALATILIANSALASAPYAVHRENGTLLPQGKRLTQTFTSKDLILMSPNVTGDNWAMLTGPLSTLTDLNTVYFFNTADLAKIPANTYEHIYLITSDNDLELFAQELTGRLKLVEDYAFTTKRLNLVDQKNTRHPILPRITQETVRGHVFLIQ